MSAEEEIFLLRDVDAEVLACVRAHWLPRLRALAPRAEVLEIGATAMPGLIGKQDLDILVRVDAQDFAATRARFDLLFPRDLRQVFDEALQAYRPEEPRMDLAIQLTISGGPYDVFTAFLERLTQDASLREAYNQLKRQWNGRAMSDYRIAKAAFIAKALP